MSQELGASSNEVNIGGDMESCIVFHASDKDFDMRIRGRHDDMTYTILAT